MINALTFQTTSSDVSTTRVVSVSIRNLTGENSAADVFNVVYDVAPTVTVGSYFDGYSDFSYSYQVPDWDSPTVGITYSGASLSGAAVTALDDSGGGHVPGALMAFDTSLYTVSGGEVYDSTDTDTGIAVTGYGTDTMTFSGTATAAVYANVLSAIRFFNTSFGNPWYETLNFTVTVTDSAGLSSTPQSTPIENNLP